jgi:hypothetical protein
MEVRAELGMDGGDSGDRVADARGHGLAGAFGLVAESPVATAQARGDGQLPVQGVELRTGGLRCGDVADSVGALDRFLQDVDALAESFLGHLVENRVGPNRRLSLTAEQGEHVDFAPRGTEQHCQVVQTLGVGEVHLETAEAELPDGATATKPGGLLGGFQSLTRMVREVGPSRGTQLAGKLGASPEMLLGSVDVAESGREPARW